MEGDMGFKRLKERNEQADFISSLPNEEHKICFVNFVQQVLDRCQSKDIQNFHLTCSYIQKSRRFSEWINFAVDHSVHILHLDIYIGNQMLPKLPPSLFTCKTLVELSIHKDFAFDIPDDSVVCFPSLKILHMELQCSRLDRVHQISKFIGRCSELEELSLDGWLGPSDDILHFTFFVPTLKKLRMYLFVQVSELELYVRAVNLEYLNISDDSLLCFVVNELPFIEVVYVDYRFLNHKVVTKEESNGAMELLKEISNAKFLSFSYRAIVALGFTFTGDLPTFPNLIHLQFDSEPIFGWKLLPLFLSNSPNLEVLILEQSPWNLTYEAESREVPVWDWDESECVPPCLLLHVKLIMIKHMDGKDNNLKMIKYLLKNSEVLLKLLVSPDLWEEICTVPIASKTCKVQYF